MWSIIKKRICRRPYKGATIHLNAWVPTATTAGLVGGPSHTRFCQPLSLHTCTCIKKCVRDSDPPLTGKYHVQNHQQMCLRLKSTINGQIPCAEPKIMSATQIHHKRANLMCRTTKRERDQHLSKLDILVQITIHNSCTDCAFRRDCQIEKCADPPVLRNNNI